MPARLCWKPASMYGTDAGVLRLAEEDRGANGQGRKAMPGCAGQSP